MCNVMLGSCWMSSRVDRRKWPAAQRKSVGRRGVDGFMWILYKEGVRLGGWVKMCASVSDVRMNGR
jgi:hypothetical protein